MLEEIDKTIALIKRAKSQKQSLWTPNAFASQFQEAEVAVRKALQSQMNMMNARGDRQFAEAVKEARRQVDIMFSKSTKHTQRIAAGGELQRIVRLKFGAPTGRIELPAINQSNSLARSVGSIRIMVSHAEKDRPIVELLNVLLQMGLGIHSSEIFISSIDGQGLYPNEDTREGIREAIESAFTVISILTPNYKKSEACMGELGAIWALKKVLFPLVVGELTLGKAAFFIDTRTCVPIAERSRIAALKDMITWHDQPVNSSTWDRNLTEFIDKLPNAISQCAK